MRSGFSFWVLPMKMIFIKLCLLFCFFQTPLLSADSRHLSATFFLSFGEMGRSPGSFNRPVGVSVDANGNIYVIDTGNNLLQKFDETGRLLHFIGGFGWDKEQFQIPVDLFVYNSLDIYVADFENGRIERYDKDLNYITSYYSNSNWESRYQFEFPQSVAMSLHGDFFIIDAQNNRITKYNTSFEPELTFGDYDWGQGILQEPSHLFVSKNDLIYVSDSRAGKILVYDYFGNYIQDFAAQYLSSPKGLCLDEQGHLFVADSKLHRVFVFDKNENLLCEFGSLGTKLGAFQEPYDVAVVREKLYVADSQNHRIQGFKLEWQK